MPLISSLEIVIRVIFLFLSIISFIGLAYSGEYNSAINNSLEVLLILILLFLVIKSIKSIKKNLYIIINFIGLLIAFYFVYTSIFIFQTPVLPYIMEMVGFILLVSITIFYRDKI